MINKRCPLPECGSSHTYAVVSRARVKIGEDGKVVLDSMGYPEKIMCRHCRNCGRDYYEDQVPKRDPRNLPPALQEMIRKVAEERAKGKEESKPVEVPKGKE